MKSEARKRAEAELMPVPDWWRYAQGPEFEEEFLYRHLDAVEAAVVDRLVSGATLRDASGRVAAYAGPDAVGILNDGRLVAVPADDWRKHLLRLLGGRYLGNPPEVVP